MAKRTLYAYASGDDHGASVAAIEARLDALVAQRAWISKDVWVVNQRDEHAWDLGLNLALSARPPKGWEADVVAIALELGALHRATKSTFVLGVHDGATDTTEDIFVVDSGLPDLEKLRARLVALPRSAKSPARGE